ncbi:MAG TPA: SOS response-associated peptidase [Gammaproteobacteria bacterium]|nr:SOS response-associated peptidase [Gammaproteobacteria bacterium]
MCGRYALFGPHSRYRVNERFGVDRDLFDGWPDRYNAAPSQRLPVVRAAGDGARELVPLRWGLVPSWSREPGSSYRTINARIETVATRPSYRQPVRRRRCLVPASGYYEWQHTGAGKQPWFIRPAEPDALWGFAGIWDRWERSGQPLESFSVLVGPPSDAVAEIHDRMPVIVPPALYRAWLDRDHTDPRALLERLGPWPGEETLAYPVSTFVNRPANDSPRCVEHLP